MSASDHLSDLQFKFERHQYTDGNWAHQIRAETPEGRKVGSLEWSHIDRPNPGVVQFVEVDPERRRQGIATRMWAEAQSSAQQHSGVPAPHHSDVRFPDGQAWVAGMANRSRGATTRKPKTAPSPDQASLF